MTDTQKEKAEVPLPVYLTKTERDLLRVRAAQQGLSMSKALRQVVRRELGLEAED